jgi:hypothetical protein
MYATSMSPCLYQRIAILEVVIAQLNRLHDQCFYRFVREIVFPISKYVSTQGYASI